MRPVEAGSLDLFELTALMAQQAQQDQKDARARAHDADRAQIGSLEAAAEQQREAGTMGLVTGMLGAGLQIASGAAQLGSAAAAVRTAQEAGASAAALEAGFALMGLASMGHELGQVALETGKEAAQLLSETGSAAATGLKALAEGAQAAGTKLQADAGAGQTVAQARAKEAETRAGDLRGLEKDAGDRRRELTRQLSSRADAEHDQRAQILRA